MKLSLCTHTHEYKERDTPIGQGTPTTDGRLLAESAKNQIVLPRPRPRRDSIAIAPADHLRRRTLGPPFLRGCGHGSSFEQRRVSERNHRERRARAVVTGEQAE